MTRAALLTFVALAYGISWAVWSPLALHGSGLLSRPPSPYLHLLGALGPALAALVTARLYGGKPALRALAQRTSAWRVPPGWHALAWGPLLLMLIPGALARSPEYPELPMLAYWAASIVCYGFGEETGWRGYLLPGLQRGMSTLRATAVVGLIWAGWHLPLFWFAPGLAQMGAAGALGWLFSLLAGAFLFSWIVNRSGSVLIAAVFHGTMDLAFTAPGMPLLANALGALVTLAGIAILIRWLGLSRLARRRPCRP